MRRRPWLVAGVVVLLPFTILVVRVLRSRYLATSDLALIESRVRDVGGRFTPLVGAYSRYGWNHPGPLLFFVLAGPYRLFGSSGSALLAAGVVLNLAAAAGCLWLLWRRGRIASVAFGGLVLLVLVRALAEEVLTFPWNPYAVVIPLLFLVLLTWSVVCGDDWLLPLVVALASFCVQSHVGTAAAAAVLVAIAIGAFAVRVGRGVVRSPWRTTIVSAVIGIVLWLPPLIDQVRPHGGNLTALLRYWTSAHAHVTGWARGARIVNAQFSIPASWMTGHEHGQAFTGGLDPGWHVPWALVFLIAAGVVAWRRRDWPSLSLIAIVLCTAITAWISAARIVGEPYPYLLRWTWSIGALAWFAVGWTALRVLAERPSVTRFGEPVLWAAVAVAVLLAAATTITGIHAQLPGASSERALRRLAPQLLAFARRTPAPVLVESAPDIGSAALADGLLLELDKRGIDARFERDGGGRGVGEHRTVEPADARTTLLTAAGSAVDTYDANPAFRRVATYDALTPDERASLVSLTDELRTYLRTAHAFDVRGWAHLHPDAFRRLTELGERDDRAAVFIEAGNP